MKYKDLTREYLEKIFKVIQKYIYRNVEWDLNNTLVDMAFITRYPTAMRLLYDTLEKIVSQNPETEVSGYALIHEVSKVLCTLDYWTVLKKICPDEREDPELNNHIWVREKRKPTVDELVDLINSEVIYHSAGFTNYDYLKMWLSGFPNYDEICEELIKQNIPLDF